VQTAVLRFLYLLTSQLHVCLLTSTYFILLIYCVLLAVDEADGRMKPLMPTTSDTATAAGGDAGHYFYPSHHEPLSVDNNAMSWTSAEVMSWLERSRLQHLADWYV